jgi:hypothetical protein
LCINYCWLPKMISVEKETEVANVKTRLCFARFTKVVIEHLNYLPIIPSKRIVAIPEMMICLEKHLVTSGNL